MIKHSGIKIMIAILMVLVGNSLFTPFLSATGNGYASYQFLPSSNYNQSDIKAVLKITADNSGLPTHQVTWKDSQGTVPCPECTTYYEYSPNGYIIASTSEFLIAGQQRPSGTYTAIVTYCSFLVGSTCISWAEMFRADFYIGDASVTYTISGNVGVAGATLSYTDGTPKVVTANSIGDYTITVPPNWSGTVMPLLADHFFSPASKTYTDVLANQLAQNYTATAITDRLYLPLVLR